MIYCKGTKMSYTFACVTRTDRDLHNVSEVQSMRKPVLSGCWVQGARPGANIYPQNINFFNAFKTVLKKPNNFSK